MNRVTYRQNRRNCVSVHYFPTAGHPWPTGRDVWGDRRTVRADLRVVRIDFQVVRTDLRVLRTDLRAALLPYVVITRAPLVSVAFWSAMATAR